MFADSIALQTHFTNTIPYIDDILFVETNVSASIYCALFNTHSQLVVFQRVDVVEKLFGL